MKITAKDGVAGMATSAGRLRRPAGDAVPSLSQEDVALRWNISPRTLERWRCESRGPAAI